MYTITKEFTFEASHSLPQLPEEHKCHRVHGHSYRVVLVLQSATLDKHGFIVDYGDLNSFKRHLDQAFDHRDLNKVMGGGENTTAERLAEYFFSWARSKWPKTKAVKVSETQKTWAEYSERHFTP